MSPCLTTVPRSSSARDGRRRDSRCAARTQHVRLKARTCAARQPDRRRKRIVAAATDERQRLERDCITGPSSGSATWRSTSGWCVRRARGRRTVQGPHRRGSREMAPAIDEPAMAPTVSTRAFLPMRAWPQRIEEPGRGCDGARQSGKIEGRPARSFRRGGGVCDRERGVGAVRAGSRVRAMRRGLLRSPSWSTRRRRQT